MLPDPGTMCLTRLCGEMGARMAELAQLPYGPRIQGERRIQGRPDVFRTNRGRTVAIWPRRTHQMTAMACDARNYLQLLRDGYVSTITHWQEVMFEVSKHRPELVVELWVLRRQEAPTFCFVEDLSQIELMTENCMSGDGVMGWWLEYCLKNTSSN